MGSEFPPTSDRENRENGNYKKSLSGKTEGIWKFCQNTGNLVGSIVNYLILKVKDILVFAMDISKFCLKLDKSAQSVLYM